MLQTEPNRPLRIAWPILSAAYSAFFLHKTWTKDYLTQGLDRRQYTLSTGGGAILYMIPPFFILLQDAIKRKMFTAAGAGALGTRAIFFMYTYTYIMHLFIYVMSGYVHSFFYRIF